MNDDRIKSGLVGPVLLSAVITLSLGVSAVTWAAMTPLAGAVISQGEAVVRGESKPVQSLDGGLVSDIHVAEGDLVKAGDALLELDPSMIEAQIDINKRRLATVLATHARLLAERDGLEDPVFSYRNLPVRLPDTHPSERSQVKIFETRKELREGRAAMAREREEQIRTRLEGIESQLVSKRETLSFIETELSNLETLNKSGLVRESRLLELRRSKSSAQGEISALISEQQQLANSAVEIGIETLQEYRAFEEEVATSIAEAEGQMDELSLQIMDLQRELLMTEMLAPVSGIVHEMAVNAPGSVVAPGAHILKIVPVEEGVEFVLRVAPADIDRVHPGQVSRIGLSALDPGKTPKLEGRVARIAPGTSTDKITGQSYYEVVVSVAPAELERIDESEIVPGMPVEGFLQTGERTVMSYLLKPLSVHLDRAFREQ